MEIKEFKITIDAPKEKVWDILWSDNTYRQWVAVFAEGSRAVTDWQKGSKVLFLGDENSGMVSTIVENKPNEYMSIKHLGTVKDGVEDLDSDESKQWAGALENYTLRTIDGKTEVTVDMDFTAVPPDMLNYFMSTWPKALEKLKQLAEQNI